MSSGNRGLVLVVEDEPAIADVLRLNLRRAGYGVELLERGEQVVATVRRIRPVAVVLDVGLPGLDGIEACRQLRAAGDWTPVLFATAHDDEVDRILALEQGADDYVTKPFSPRELVARVTGVLRRVNGAPTPSSLAIGGLVLDPDTRQVRVEGAEVGLTATEFDLLAHLMHRPGRVYTREELLGAVWGYSSTAGTRTVDVHVAQLRAKLGEASPIRTVRGVGYSAAP